MQRTARRPLLTGTQAVRRAGWLVALIALVVQLLQVMPVCAGVLDEAQEALAELARRAVLIRESVSRSRQQETEQASLLLEKERQLRREQRELQRLADEVSKLESEIVSLKRMLSQQEDDAKQLATLLDNTRESIETQLRYLQRHVRAEDFLPFFMPDSLTEAAIVGRSFDQVLRLTNRLANDYLEELSRLREKRSELVRTMSELEARQSELNGVREMQEVKVAQLKSSVEAISAELEQTRGNVADLETVLNRIEERRAELQALIEKEEREAAERAREENENWVGSFLWPVSGTVRARSDAGKEHDETNPGIDIEAGDGAKVVASKSGQVVLSGWVEGHGNTVVINHGGGYSSVYSRCRSLMVAVGDFVIAGEVIAEIGSDSGSPPCLHFEIRKNGVPVETLQYLVEN